VFRAQLAGCDVKDVRSPDQGVELVPGGYMCDVVGVGGVFDPVSDLHRTIGGYREVEQQLLSVGADVLIVSMTNRRCRPPVAVAAVGVGVVAGHRDGGRVVVQLGGLDGELADDAQDRMGDQARPVAVEEQVQHPAYRSSLIISASPGPRRAPPGHRAPPTPRTRRPAGDRARCWPPGPRSLRPDSTSAGRPR
jgi:hypothetical protein